MSSSAARNVSIYALILCSALAHACGDDDTNSSNTIGVTEAGADGGGKDTAGEGGSAAAGKAGDATAGKAGDSGPRAGARAAGGDLDAGSEPGDQLAVDIRFAARVGREPFACGRSYERQGRSAVTVTPVDLRLYVQDVRLVTRDGREVPVQLDVREPFQSAVVALLDFEDASGSCGGDSRMNDHVTGRVPAGEYTALRFSNAVPTALNHGDPRLYPTPLKAPGMSWNWLLGLRFVKAELTTESADLDAGAAPGGALHLGSTACSGNPTAGDITCKKPNRNRVQLEGYEIGRSVVVLDVAEIFKASDLTQVEECHSAGPPCESMFRSLGVDFATGAASERQTVYRLEKP